MIINELIFSAPQRAEKLRIPLFKLIKNQIFCPHLSHKTLNFHQDKKFISLNVELCEVPRSGIWADAAKRLLGDVVRGLFTCPDREERKPNPRKAPRYEKWSEAERHFA
ncbi:TPA: hypothetical protein DIS57_03330 [Candidatus Wolfebacteria bacterium]|nr:hypothetical protein [Candidatus Wolfebacteria bacterium]